MVSDFLKVEMDLVSSHYCCSISEEKMECGEEETDVCQTLINLSHPM